MAITDVIDTSVPDGSTQTVAVLDNAIRDHKRQVKERMEDSIIDTGVEGWTTTGTKELQEGIARVHTDVIANIPVLRLADGKLFIRTDPPDPDDATEVFEYYNGSAWVPVKIGSTNFVNQSVVTAAIADGAVTAAKLASGANFIYHGQVTNGSNLSTNATSWGRGTIPSTALGFFAANSNAITPASSGSLVIYVLEATIRVTGGSSAFGYLRIRKTTAGDSGIQTLAALKSHESASSGSQDHPVTLIGYLTGEAQATDVQIEIGHSSGGANTMNIDGSKSFDSESLITRFSAYELL